MDKFSGTWTTKHYVFLIFVAALIIHIPIDHRKSMFPTLVFPAFDEAPKLDKFVTISFVELSAQTDQQHNVKLSKGTFFKGLYEKHANFFLNAIFRREINGYHDQRTEDRRKDFARYSIEQLSRLYPGQRFETLIISRFKRRYNLVIDQLEPQKIDEKQVSLSLL